MKFFLPGICIAILSLSPKGQQENFDAFCSRFVDVYKSQKVRPLELSYASGLEHIGSVDEVRKQYDFFTSVRVGLSRYAIGELSPSQRLNYRLIDYESKLSLERLSLEEEWTRHRPKKVPAGGILTIPNGKAWYAWLLRRWVSAEVTPDEVYQFGLRELSRAKTHIEAIRQQTGLSEDSFYSHLNDPSFFVSDPAAVQALFEHTKTVVYANLPNLFSDARFPGLGIERGANKDLAQTPGYYDNNNFYYNLFDKPYNTRQVDWLFIHEGVPGHHYQSSLRDQANSSSVQRLFWYSGFAEGWAAYTEELGRQLGLYTTPYAELGKWEWDLVRSVRVPLDVGLNYYGWTDGQALAFWKKNIRNQDDIALREINRMRRWPAQVVTYKYGARQIMHWKEELQRREGKDFDIRRFHDRLLRQGNLPLWMMKEQVLGAS